MLEMSITSHNIDFVIDKPVTILSLIRYFIYYEATRQVLNPNKRFMGHLSYLCNSVEFNEMSLQYFTEADLALY